MPYSAHHGLYMDIFSMK